MKFCVSSFWGESNRVFICMKDGWNLLEKSIKMFFLLEGSTMCRRLCVNVSKQRLDRSIFQETWSRKLPQEAWCVSADLVVSVPLYLLSLVPARVTDGLAWKGLGSGALGGWPATTMRAPQTQRDHQESWWFVEGQRGGEDPRELHQDTTQWSRLPTPGTLSTCARLHIAKWHLHVLLH